MSDGTKPTRRVALKVLGGTLGAGAFAYASRPIVYEGRVEARATSPQSANG